jgi:hypothetical protein
MGRFCFIGHCTFDCTHADRLLVNVLKWSQKGWPRESSKTVLNGKRYNGYAMTGALTKDQLDLRLAEIDEQLSGVPRKYRALAALKVLYGTVADDALRISLLGPIVLWFIEKYGDSAKWDGVIGKGPIIIRGNVYLIAFPFTSGDACLKLVDHIENLPQNVEETFTEEEFKDVGRRAAGAMMHFGTLYDLTVQDTFLDEVEKGLVWRGLADLEIAANSIKQSEDTQNAIFHTHQAAEKFLKVALRRSGFKGTLKSLGHDLPKIFQELCTLKSRYTWLKSSVDSLQNFAPSMEIRYGSVPRTVENAVSSFYSALNVCAVLAKIWLFDFARGTDKATFVPGTFYTDGNGNDYHCENLVLTTDKRPGATLRRLGNYPIGALMMDIVRDMDQSSLHLEISDTQQVEQLRRLYRLHMQMRGTEKKPEDMGIKITSGPEGSYMTQFSQGKLNIKR